MSILKEDKNYAEYFKAACKDNMDLMELIVDQEERYSEALMEPKKLKQHYVHNLRELRRMKEIVDVLYESLETQEVIYLILVAVTSQIGFGFNRAFFLHVRGNDIPGFSACVFCPVVIKAVFMTNFDKGQRLSV